MNSLTKESLAALINGREYLSEITDAEVAQAKAAGLVVIFGYSDDNIELRGAIEEEVGAYDGTTFTIDAKGLAPQWDEDGMTIEAARDFFEREDKGVKVEAKWDHKGYSWFIESIAQAATFDIMEDGERFFRGIVIDVRDLAEKPKPVAFEDGGASIRGGMKYTLAAAMEDAREWISGATFHAESRGWRPAVALLREEILRLRPFEKSVAEIEVICADLAEKLAIAHDKHAADAAAFNACDRERAELVGQFADLRAKNLELAKLLVEKNAVIALAKEQFAAEKKRAEAAEARQDDLIYSICHARQCADGKSDEWRVAVVKILNAAIAAHPVITDTQRLRACASIVERIADWSRKYPQGNLPSQHALAESDATIGKIEEDAKAIFPAATEAEEGAAS